MIVIVLQTNESKICMLRKTDFREPRFRSVVGLCLSLAQTADVMQSTIVIASQSVAFATIPTNHRSVTSSFGLD